MNFNIWNHTGARWDTLLGMEISNYKELADHCKFAEYTHISMHDATGQNFFTFKILISSRLGLSCFLQAILNNYCWFIMAASLCAFIFFFLKRCSSCWHQLKSDWKQLKLDCYHILLRIRWYVFILVFTNVLVAIHTIRITMIARTIWEGEICW